MVNKIETPTTQAVVPVSWSTAVIAPLGIAFITAFVTTLITIMVGQARLEEKLDRCVAKDQVAILVERIRAAEAEISTLRGKEIDASNLSNVVSSIVEANDLNRQRIDALIAQNGNLIASLASNNTEVANLKPLQETAASLRERIARLEALSNHVPKE